MATFIEEVALRLYEKYGDEMSSLNIVLPSKRARLFFAEALSKLMQDDNLRRNIQKNGIENVKRFSIENSVEQYDAMIQKLCPED